MSTNKKRTKEHTQMIDSSIHIRRSLCEYDACREGLPEPPMCDCKFGAHENIRALMSFSEVTGCAEMRHLEAMLRVMTPTEWKNIQNRIINLKKQMWKKRAKTKATSLKDVRR